jgi:hypothetical protein
MNFSNNIWNLNLKKKTKKLKNYSYLVERFIMCNERLITELKDGVDNDTPVSLNNLKFPSISVFKGGFFGLSVLAGRVVTIEFSYFDSTNKKIVVFANAFALSNCEFISTLHNFFGLPTDNKVLINLIFKKNRLN